jgi:hypothetical protein
MVLIYESTHGVLFQLQTTKHYQIQLSDLIALQC